MSVQTCLPDPKLPPSVFLPARGLPYIFPEAHQHRAEPQRVYLADRSAWTFFPDNRRCVFGLHVEDLAAKALRDEFNRLRVQWREERGASSSITEIAMYRSHLQIIGLGRAAIPLILRRMEDEWAEPDMWFVALQMLTGVDPVTDEIRGDFCAMARRWLDWAAAHGYAW